MEETELLPPEDEKPKRHFKGVWTPAVLYDDPELDAFDRELLAEINLLDDGVRGCFASNAYFAARRGVTAGSIANRLTRLRRMGYIQTLDFNGRTRRICVPILRGHIIDQGSLPSSTNESSLHQRMKDKAKGKTKSKWEPSVDFSDEEVQAEWAAFQTMRKQKGSPMTQIGRGRAVAKLSRWNKAAQLAALRMATESEWQGLYEPKPRSIRGGIKADEPDEMDKMVARGREQLREFRERQKGKT